jgi:hypothetical protein
MKSGGIINAIMSRYLSSRFPKAVPMRSSLKLHQLIGVFEVFGMSLVIISFVFLLEIGLQGSWVMFQEQKEQHSQIDGSKLLVASNDHYTSHVFNLRLHLIPVC